MGDVPFPKAISSSCHPVRSLLVQDLPAGPLLSEATIRPWDLGVMQTPELLPVSPQSQVAHAAKS